MPKGVFLSLDGPDGGGKTTQIAALADWLRARGREVVTCRDPGGTPLGDRLRALVMGRDEAAIGPTAEMLLFMASRAQLVEQVIRPALDAGRVVICDRFLLANVVYQGYAGDLPPRAIWEIGAVATGGLMPDLTVVLDVPPEVARGRIGGPRDRMEDRTEDRRDRVRAGFLEAARSYPAPIAVIDAAADPAEVAARIRSEVEHALGPDPRP